MGCGPSKPRRKPTKSKSKRRNISDVELRPITISGPSGGPVIVPTQRRNQQGQPVKYDQHRVSGERLTRALVVVADFLHDRNLEPTLFTCGGAVNTIHLRSRKTTADVDFFMPELTPEVAVAIEAAATHAIAKMSVPLSQDWLNNAQTLIIPRRVQEILAAEARQQNTVVFRRVGLTVLAVPWSYALMTKIARLSDPDKMRDYDPDDAAAYLHQHIQLHRGRPVSLRQIEEWGKRYEMRGGPAQVQIVADAYMELYGREGIVE